VGDVDLDTYDVPEQVARYIETAPLGEGGLGEVVECFDQDLRRRLALKRPRAERTDGRSMAALVKEAQITAQLEHPNIPPVYALGVDDEGRPFFTMARLSGHTLADLLDEPDRVGKDCVFGPAKALMRDLHGPGAAATRRLRLVLQVAYGLAYAHHRGVLHRDLKPSNIMVGDFGQVHLVDWGIAKVIGADDDDAAPPITVSAQAHTTQGSFVGTVQYASPEQLEGRTDLDARSDIYSLGAVIYALFKGHSAVVDADPETVRKRVLAGDLDPLTPGSAVSHRLVAVVEMAMARDRNDRYDTVLELIGDLESLLDGGNVKAVEEGPIRRIGRFYFSRPRALEGLRVIDLEKQFAGGLTAGVAVGLLASAWVSTTWLPWIAGTALIAGVIIAAPRWVKVFIGHHAADDPERHAAEVRSSPTTSSRSQGGHSHGRH
jgi:serine/threonine-protein kinase